MTGEVIERVTHLRGTMWREVETVIGGAGEIDREQRISREVHEIKAALQGIGALETNSAASIDVGDHARGP